MPRRSWIDVREQWFSENDVASDVRGIFSEAQDRGLSDVAAASEVRRQLAESLSDVDDYPEIILALAWLLVDGPTLPRDLAAEALKLIQQEASRPRYEELVHWQERRRWEEQLLRLIETRLSGKRIRRAPRGRAMRARNYQEGDWFLVPLESGGSALGRIARAYGGDGILGFFFGPRYVIGITGDDIPEKRAEDAVLVARLGDSFLREGRWPVIHRSEPFDRARWPVPVFGRVDKFGANKAWRVTYAEEDLDRTVSEELTTPDQVRDLPVSGTWGVVAVERRLDRLLAEPPEHHG
jgi:hypothetical protein